MSRVPRFLLLALLLGLALPARAADKPPEGSWKLSYFQGIREVTLAIVKIENKDGRLSADLVARHPNAPGLAVKEVRRDGNELDLVFSSPPLQLTFEGQLASATDKRILGVLAQEGRSAPAELTATDKTSLDPKEVVRLIDTPGLDQAQQLAFKPLLLRSEAQQTADEGKKKELLRQADEAEKKAQEELPKIYEEIVDKHADSPAVFGAAQQVLRLEAKAKADPAKIKKVVETTDKAAAAYGPRWQAAVEDQLATELVNMGVAPEVALDQAEAAAKQLKKDAPPAQQAQTLQVLEYAQRLAGKKDEARETGERVAKLNADLDKEYQDKTPPFKPQPYEGRKGKSDRAVVLELFTGAQCPPCVAADVAFDALEKTYKPQDVILLEYHEHIPGPDALASPDSIARFDYYAKAFPMEVGGTPTTVFDGKPEAGGGGPLQAAQSKYDEYRKILDKQLEEPAGAKLTAKARRSGEKIDIEVEVSGLEQAGSDTRLRVALVEEVVHYVGGNQVRLSHHVVRDMPGGVEGIALKDKDSKQTVHVDLNEVRNKLVKYLRDYAINQQPFPTVQRPLELKNLYVVAFVQDDKSHKILQGVQVDVKGGEKEGE